MNLEKQKAFLIRFTYIIVILGIIYISIKYFLPTLMPFVIGLFIAALLKPVIDFISKHLHINRAVVSILLLLIFYSILGLLTAFLGVKLVYFIRDLVFQLTDVYQSLIQPTLEDLARDLPLMYPDLEVYLEESISSISNSIISFISKASTVAVSTATGFAGQIPNFLIRFIFTIVSSFFFTIDFHKITGFILRQYPTEKREMIITIKDNVIGTIGKFLRAYATLISITFIELSIGFSILHISNPFLLGAVVAIVDVLPILGTGAVLLPWAVIAFVFGMNELGIGLLILYIVITVVRQTLEPRVVGQQIGLHPVVTLICIFVGAQLLGVVGLFMLPVTATILKKMNDEGTIHLFK
ncbi:MAG: putative rane protein [Lachnospiraceae bacterium]|jgi:sporulation integral membrane protein YtvI|nr:putative rane protein [Lachnospiraceae bacterium]